MTDNYIRKAFLMSVHEGRHAEYKKRHDEIWPELVTVLKDFGARNYSIFLDARSNSLFAYVEVRNEKQWAEIANTDICKEWWLFMKDIMETNPDSSPVSKELDNLFYMK